MDSLDARLSAAIQLGLAEGQWDTALREVRLMLVDHSSSPKALLALAVCYFHKRQFTESITWLDQAARQVQRLGADAMTGTRSAIHLFRGLSYAARRLPAAARADFVDLQRLDPSPIKWRRFADVLRPDEMARARIAAEQAGLPEVDLPAG